VGEGKKEDEEVGRLYWELKQGMSCYHVEPFQHQHSVFRRSTSPYNLYGKVLPRKTLISMEDDRERAHCVCVP